MSKTYRNNGDGTTRSDGGKNYATPRYQPGSRRRPRNVVARGDRRPDVDYQKFGQVIVEAAVLQAQREAAAREQYTDPSGEQPSNSVGERGEDD